MRYWIHCSDCETHSEIASRGAQEFCGCSSLNWTPCDGMEPGECAECDEVCEWGADSEDRNSGLGDLAVDPVSRVSHDDRGVPSGHTQTTGGAGQAEGPRSPLVSGQAGDSDNSP